MSEIQGLIERLKAPEIRKQPGNTHVCYTVEFLDEVADALERMHKALEEIAAFNDKLASARLEATGSYTAFDEPGSVETARRALNRG